MTFEPFIALRYFGASGTLALIGRILMAIVGVSLAVIAVHYLFPLAIYAVLIFGVLALFAVVMWLLLSSGSQVALISAISILGVAIGVAALVISLSLLSGFQDRIRAQMADRTPHLVVSPVRGDRLADPERVRSVLSALPGVRSVSPVIEGRGWLADEAGRRMSPVRYRNSPVGFFGPLEAQSPPPARVGSAAAARIEAEPGSRIRMISSRETLSPIGPIPISAVLRVAEIRRTAALEKVPDVEIPEAVARRLAGIGSGARAYEVRLSDPKAADHAASLVTSRLSAGDRVQTWRDLNAPLSFALRLEKGVIFATVALIVVVAALNIISNIALLVVDKKRDLGVLSSMGATPRSLAGIYLALGATIGGLGMCGGIAVGVGASVLLDRLQLIPLPGDVYLLSHVPFSVHPLEVVEVAVFAFATAVGAAVLPARAAARLAPGEAVRLSR